MSNGGSSNSVSVLARILSSIEEMKTGELQLLSIGNVTMLYCWFILEMACRIAVVLPELRSPFQIMPLPFLRALLVHSSTILVFLVGIINRSIDHLSIPSANTSINYPYGNLSNDKIWLK